MVLPFSLTAQPAGPVRVNISEVSYRAIWLPEAPDFLATDGDDAWVIDDNHNRLQKISVKSDRPLLIVDIPGACAAPVVGFNAVWVMSCSEKELYKIDKNSGRIIEKIITGIADAHGEMSLAIGDGSVWLLSDSTGVLERIDPHSNTIRSKIAVRPHSYCAGFGYHSIWITNTGENSVQRIDIKTDSVISTIPVGKKPRFLAVGEQGVWTLNQGDGTVTRIDPLSAKVVATIDVKAPGGGGDITAGAGKIWIVSTNTERPLQTINPANNTVEKIYMKNAGNGTKIKVDGAVRISTKYVWVSDLFSKTVWALKK